jgi:hypothetical protein
MNKMERDLSQINYYGYANTKIRFIYKETITDSTSDALMIPKENIDAVVSVSPGTSATVQFTISSFDNVKNGNAIWIDWDNGEITEVTASTITGNITALRLISVGESTWEVAK